MKHNTSLVTLFTFLCASTQAFASHNNYLLFEVGGFVSSAGEEQHIDIEGLIGNNYTVSDHTDVKPLAGLGYFANVLHHSGFELDLGVNAFYLFPVQVKGDVIQEDLFENLSYQYNIGNLPIYLEAKGNIFIPKHHRYAVTLDLGIGPDIMFLSDYQETSLDGGITIPDDAFTNHTSVTFSATAGIGVKFYDVGGSPALELGYRFFYLGEGEFGTKSNQFEDNLSTGQVYANALIFAITI